MMPSRGAPSESGDEGYLESPDEGRKWESPDESRGRRTTRFPAAGLWLSVSMLLVACSGNPNPKAYAFPPPEKPAVGTVVEGIASWYGPGYDGKTHLERRGLRPGCPHRRSRLLGVRHPREGHLPVYRQERRRPH